MFVQHFGYPMVQTPPSLRELHSLLCQGGFWCRSCVRRQGHAGRMLATLAFQPAKPALGSPKKDFVHRCLSLTQSNTFSPQ